MKTSETYTIGSLAKSAGVGIQTIRFYERKGLLQQPERKNSGYRQYSANDAKQIRFIKRAQELGFTLKEVKTLLELQAVSTSTCKAVKKQADLKLIEVNEKIKDLEKMKQSLKEISKCCSKGQATSQVCQMSDCFEGNC